MFTKKTKKVRSIIKEAIDNNDFKKALEFHDVEFEGWKQGFKSGMTASIGGIALGVIGARIIINLTK